MIYDSIRGTFRNSKAASIAYIGGLSKSIAYLSDDESRLWNAAMEEDEGTDDDNVRDVATELDQARMDIFNKSCDEPWTDEDVIACQSYIRRKNGE